MNWMVDAMRLLGDLSGCYWLRFVAATAPRSDAPCVGTVGARRDPRLPSEIPPGSARDDRAAVTGISRGSRSVTPGINATRGSTAKRSQMMRSVRQGRCQNAIRTTDRAA